MEIIVKTVGGEHSGVLAIDVHKFGFSYLLLIAAFSIGGTHFLAASREKKALLKSQKDTFIESLLPCIDDLHNSSETPASIVLAYYPEHERNARKLALHLPESTRRIFVTEWASYKKTYIEKKPMENFAGIVSEVDEIPEGNLLRPGIEEYFVNQDRKRKNIIIGQLRSIIATL